MHDYGVARLYHPEDGRHMGLQGMINDLLQQCDFPVGINLNGEVQKFLKKDTVSIARRFCTRMPTSCSTLRARRCSTSSVVRATNAPISRMTSSPR